MRNNSTGTIVWFTGLPSAGKTTLAGGLAAANDRATVLLDGDSVRKCFVPEPGFSPEERSRNVLQVSRLAVLIAQQGFDVAVAVIAPFEALRTRAKQAAEEGGSKLLFIYLSTTLEVCEGRDVKGLYARARAGEVEGLTGVSSAYEPPEAPDFVIDTARVDVESAVRGCLALLRSERSPL